MSGPSLNYKRYAHFLIAVALLFATRSAFDLSSSAAYVYPQYGYGHSLLFFLLFLAIIAYVAVFTIVRLFQRRFVEGAVLFLILVVQFSYNEIIDRHYWKFRLHKPEYQSIVQSDPSPPPKFRLFNWGNRNTSLGGGFIVEGIVYDESGEIRLDPEARSAEWMKRRANPTPDDFWLTAPPSKHQKCEWLIKPFGEHFYYVAEEC